MNTVTGSAIGILGLPLRYWGILALALASLFVIGLEQGQTFSVVWQQVGQQNMILHEIFHDVRHVAAFACH